MNRMDTYKWREILTDNPIIAAANHAYKVDRAIESPCQVVFLLFGNLFDLDENIEKLKMAGKMVFVHLDLLEGFAKDEVTIQYIGQKTQADGIITTRVGLIKLAKHYDLLTIQRLFLIDSLSFEAGIKSLEQSRPSAVEILPGIMDPITESMAERIDIPVVSGGFIKSKHDIIGALKAGAQAVSTSQENLWSL